MRRCYLYVMTETVMSVVRKHHYELFTPEVVERYNLDERKILSSVTLPELDEAYTRYEIKMSIWRWITHIYS